MKGTHFLYWYILSACLFLLNGCQKDDFNEPNGIRISFKALLDRGNSGDTLILKEAFLGVQALDLKRYDEADSSTVEKIVYNGPYVVDLLKGTVSPAIRWIFAEPGHYREIKVITYNALPHGKSIRLSGTILPAEGEEAIPFEFSSSQHHNLSVINNAGITIREGENTDLVVVFKLSDLFRGVNLSELERNEKGVLVISENNSPGTAALILNSLETFTRFGLDNNMLFPDFEDEIPDDGIPGEVVEPEDPGNDEEDEPGDGSDGGQEDNPSDDGTGEQGNNGGGSGEDDENDDSSGEGGDNDSGNNNDNDSAGGNGGTSSDDDEETSGNDDDNEPDDKQEDDDEGGDDNPDDDDNDGEDDDKDNDEDGDDDKDDDEKDDDDKDDDKDDDDKNKGKNKGKGDKGKGNN